MNQIPKKHIVYKDIHSEHNTIYLNLYACSTRSAHKALTNLSFYTGMIINSVSDPTADSHVNDCRQGKHTLQNIIFLSNLIYTEILIINMNESKADFIFKLVSRAYMGPYS